MNDENSPNQQQIVGPFWITLHLASTFSGHSLIEKCGLRNMEIARNYRFVSGFEYMLFR